MTTCLVRTAVASAVAWFGTACANETGIVLEISLSAELGAALDERGEDFETLRIWVGHTTDDPRYFAASSDAYHSRSMSRDDLDVPFRYLLEPTSEDLTTIGQMVFAAAVGDDPDDERLPFRLSGFAVSGAAMDFQEGEIRVVPLSLVPPDGAMGTIDDGCIVWGMDTQTPSRITPADDLDCDNAVGVDDCDDRDPGRNNLDADEDGFSSCDGDCMDDPDFRVPWLDPATVNPGATDDESDGAVCDHVDNDCDGVCLDPTLDRDGSGSTTCGAVEAVHGVCAVEPADCDEEVAGQQPGSAVVGEACNGRDDACDGFLAPAIPCIIPDQPDKCYFGQVACDELRGEFIGEPDAFDCKPLPGAFSQTPAPPILCSAPPPPESCLESPDPVACPTGNGFARLDCQLPLAEAPCPASRTPLAVPGMASPEQCAWHIVGGVEQAEWEVGFVDANSTGTLAPMATIGSCTPHLVARTRSRFATPRTVLLVLIDPLDLSFGARPLIVHLSATSGDLCATELLCQPTAGN
ncbi:MAG: hypothetical protein K8M05_01975 [Deltaproteobacteria bacterium]|nr:hypothetical protein [Kofleriaceae bacterium]